MGKDIQRKENEFRGIGVMAAGEPSAKKMISSGNIILLTQQ
ncbi:MAG: hypothetical protein QXT36_03160 [Candidatus Micrarchaeaceae archaeon]